LIAAIERTRAAADIRLSRPASAEGSEAPAVEKGGYLAAA